MKPTCLLLAFALPIVSLAATASAAVTDPFSDVGVSNPNYIAISYLKDHDVISGYPDGSFKPDQVVNRAEALKIILLGSGVQVPASIDLEPFRDILRTDWFAPYVSKAKELAIVQGYNDGTFKPSQAVNLVENLKILLLTQKIDVSTITVSTDPYADAFKDQWYAPFVEYAKEKNLIDADAKNMVFPAQGMTRGKLAESMYRLMYITTNGLQSYSTGDTQQTRQTQQTTQQSTQQTTQQSTQQTTQQQSTSINISNFAFSPASLTVKAGSTVTWTNNDATTHTVTGDTGTTLNSGNLAPSQTYSKTFTTQGTFGYHCSIHPFMTGTVTVTQ